MLIKRKTLYHSVFAMLEKYLGPPDPRVTKWAMFKSPFNFLSILTIYWSTIYLIYVAMRSRRALRLRRLLVVYNFAQVIFSFYIFKEALISWILSKYEFSCSILDRSQNVASNRMIGAVYWFYISKIFDLLDTVFFALRKKKEQMTFLHMYHHSSMIFNWYLGTVYLPGGQIAFSLIFNSFVHIIMYTYYMLTAMGPHVRKYLWWKKYLTQMQIVQFVAIMAHLFYGLYTECPAPRWLLWFTVTYLWTLLILFGQFYYKTYGYQRFKSYKTLTIAALDAKAGGDYKNS